MNYLGSMGRILLATLVVAVVFGATSAMAVTITSPSYKIDGNMGGSFGGQTSSTSYKMSTIGGEAIVGSGASGSYMLDQRAMATSAQTMQLGVQPSGLVGYYPMDENDGTTTGDASQYQNDGTLDEFAGWAPTGKIGAAVDVLSTTGVRVADNPSLPSGQQMTMTAWVNHSSLGTPQTIAGQWDALGDGTWVVQAGANKSIQMHFPVEGDQFATATVATQANSWSGANTWRYVVVTYDGTKVAANERVQIYIDGAPQSVSVTGVIPGQLADTMADFVMGSWTGRDEPLDGYIDHVKLFNRALSPAEIAAEYAAQNAGISTGLTLGTLTSGSTTSLVDTIVRTNASDYTLAVQQDHDLESGSNTIPAIGGSIATPATWSEGVTKGLGFTLTGAPTLDSKWNGGAKYAALPTAATTFYSATGHVASVVDVVNLRLRLDTTSSQPVGAYSNTITYTGTTIP